MTLARRIARPAVCSDGREEVDATARCGSYQGFEIAKVVRVGDVGVVGYLLCNPTDQKVLYLLPWNTLETGN